ncbi:putative alpha-mannosidase [Quercus suber]|uniref:Alpha-mannosidase n=1 Tax=Quercus suber TaxID=58331 RepID=A0AAW0L0V0_QUESU
MTKIEKFGIFNGDPSVGWFKTVDEYYGACVQNVLDSLVPALLADQNRKLSMLNRQICWSN